MGINKFNERIELREKYSRFRHVFPCKQNTRERDSEIRIISKKKNTKFSKDQETIHPRYRNYCIVRSNALMRSSRKLISSVQHLDARHVNWNRVGCR